MEIEENKEDNTRELETVDGEKLTFWFLKNDQKAETLKKLVDLKTIISSQLPKMGKAYITRFIFDRVHK